eukprot:gnl/Hemi2/8236_TR2839_c0_g1_i1.p1 gnl/Hemi2/8236_TR2839_c0_g1~~gnl/Hemi2/8236_TR2839_c0_g1_i1.p1  ORF type:complete len:356 (+),score=61.90 gnl/Hemi2/8236_TR2839_c0_g1_i1:84-1151(+)
MSSPGKSPARLVLRGSTVSTATGKSEARPTSTQSTALPGLGNFRWRVVPTHGTPPAPRVHHTATLVARRLFIIGGLPTPKPNGVPLSDLAILDLDLVAWTTHALPGAPARSHHTATLAGEYIYVFGGWDGHTRSNTLLRLHTERLSWESVATQGEAILGHSSHTATPILGNSQIVIIGRQLGQRRWTDLHVYDVASNTVVRRTSSLSSRSGHTSTKVGNTLLVYGGRDGTTLDVVDLKTCKSSGLTFDKKLAPRGRAYHSCELVASRFLLIVGGKYLKSNNDPGIVFLDAEAVPMRWGAAVFAGGEGGAALPPAVSGHSGTLIAPTTLLVFGGEGPAGKCSNQLLQIDFDTQASF